MSTLRFDKKDVFKNIGKNRKLKEEILERVNELDTDEESATAIGLESLRPQTERAQVDLARDLLSGGAIESHALEAIVQRFGRPAIRLFENNLLPEDIENEASTIQEELAPHLVTIEKIVQSVGRIELKGHPRLPWVGTGWVVDEDILVTNRHVANEFGFRSGDRFSFYPGVFGGQMEASIDFYEEHNNPRESEFTITEVLYIEPGGGPDVAFLKVNWESGDDPEKSHLKLWNKQIHPEQKVAVIGYPAKDSRTNIPADMDRIYKSVYNVKRFAPGEVLSISEQQGLLTHDCTTLGGNSGSALVDLESGEAIALHFAGREQQANFAVLASVVNSRLNDLKSGVFPSGLGGALSNEVTEEIPTLEEMEGRVGYDPDFLSKHVPLPRIEGDLRQDIAPVQGSDEGELKYIHYSVVMNRTRKIAFFSAVNIDGGQLFKIPRGSDKWFFDPRISLNDQVGNRLYKHNPLDRGHLVRRLDPSWGADRDVAKSAIEDTFFYTNCAPQHLTLNRNMWLGLEDHILNNSGEFDLKLCVFSGPVFREDDQEYREIQIPNEFWKVVAIVVPEGSNGAGKLSVTGYVLSQRSLVDDLEFVFADHQGYQVKLELIEELTGLDFGELKNSDPLSRELELEATETREQMRTRRLRSLDDIVLR